MKKFILFVIRLGFTFLNAFLFKIVWNEGLLYFFPTLPILTYWYAFLLYYIKELFGLHPTIATYVTDYLKEEGRTEEEIATTISLANFLMYLVVIVLIKIIL